MLYWFAVVIIAIFSVIITPQAFAQNTYVINIPTGAADPNAPYFWQSEKDGSTTGDIHINKGDSVRWENADTAPHTVTSGIPKEGPDEIFDSALFAPGKSFSFTFEDLGEYPYFCLIHPWMTGTVMVGSGLHIIPEVGADAGDGETTFDVEYQFNRVISEAKVDESQKAITFTIIGSTKSDDHNLNLLIPKNLLNDPYAIWVDGEQRTDFDLSSEGGINNLNILLTESTEQIIIVGSSVVPEFGTIAGIVLALSVFPLILLRKIGLIAFPKL